MSLIEKHEDDMARNVTLTSFLGKIQDSKDLPAIRNYITAASKALAMCSAGEKRSDGTGDDVRMFPVVVGSPGQSPRLVDL